MSNYDLILFDLGGVLIELTGIPEMLAWTGNTLTEEQLWHKWQHSSTVRAFESGKIDTETFAKDMVREFELTTTEDVFLRRFEVWPRGLYTGVHQYLTNLKEKYTLGCLSNTNALHWERFTREFNLEQYFNHVFVSHKVGSLKPDATFFIHALDNVSLDAHRILYCDDLPLNVSAARDAGIDAYQTKGFHEVKNLIEEKTGYTDR